MVKKIMLGILFILLVLFIYPSLSIQFQKPNLRRFLMDVTSFDKDRSLCFNKAERAILPDSSYISGASFGINPIVINIIRWGHEIDYGSSVISLQYSPELCSNSPKLDTKRGSSAILSLEFVSNGKNKNIGSIEVLVTSNTIKKLSEPDNYDQILQKYASEFKLKQISQEEYVLEGIEGPGEGPGFVQVMSVDYGPQVGNFINPRFITRDNGNTWEFDSTHY